MNTLNKKLLVLALAATPFMAYGGAYNASMTYGAINSVSTALTTDFAFVAPAGGNNGSINGGLTVTASNNDPDGFEIKVVGTNGYFQNTSTSGSDDGDRLSVSTECAAMATEEASEAVASEGEVGVTTTAAKVLSVTDPSHATSANTSLCSFNSYNDNVKDLLAGVYTETITFSIHNK